VGADHAHGVTGFPAISDRESNNCARVACEVVLAAGLQSGRPRVTFLVGQLLGACSA
jgi:hypothetical protein